METFIEIFTLSIATDVTARKLQNESYNYVFIVYIDVLV